MGKSTISTGPFSIAFCNKLPEDNLDDQPERIFRATRRASFLKWDLGIAKLGASKLIKMNGALFLSTVGGPLYWMLYMFLTV